MVFLKRLPSNQLETETRLERLECLQPTVFEIPVEYCLPSTVYMPLSRYQGNGVWPLLGHVIAEQMKVQHTSIDPTIVRHQRNSFGKCSHIPSVRTIHHTTWRRARGGRRPLVTNHMPCTVCALQRTSILDHSAA